MTPRTMRAGRRRPGHPLHHRAQPAGPNAGRRHPHAGICAIAFGRDDAELIADLRKRFDKAELVPAKGNTGWLADAVAFVASQTGEHPLAATFPLDVRATAFQQRVWKALQQIPRGQTAATPPSPASSASPPPPAPSPPPVAQPRRRRSPLPPRHRSQDGSLTGYRWGLERKRKILAAEAL
jgi:AraC family transcriptional regulator of adaptative response/methylated-DNA-[protein]-cysteine methyltransferase